MNLKHLPNRAFLSWIEACNDLSTATFVPFCITDKVVGAIHHDNLSLFHAHPEVFVCHNDSIHLHPRLETPQERTHAVEKITRAWYAQGLLPTWRNEPYRVATHFDAEALMLLERAAASLFGIQRYGVHLNGIVKQDNDVFMWIGRRSPHSPTYPDMLDQLVAGGVAAGFSPRDTLVKECAEEASIPTTLACQAKPVGVISYALAHNQRLIRDILFLYDLELPPDFVPQIHDDEVSQFYLWPLEKIAQIVATRHDFKLNTNLVIIDFLIRHAYLSADDPHYVEICVGLRQHW
jgi:8-oxo-dGTP pyrophosphatase MutT (NUDIX family)